MRLPPLYVPFERIYTDWEQLDFSQSWGFNFQGNPITAASLYA